jgi:hypothetical protein
MPTRQIRTSALTGTRPLPSIVQNPPSLITNIIVVQNSAHFNQLTNFLQSPYPFWQLNPLNRMFILGNRRKPAGGSNTPAT